MLAYERRHGDAVLRVALNLSHEAKPLPFRGETLLSTLPGSAHETLRADEGIIIR